MNLAGALPVGRYALPNSLPVAAGLYHRLQNGICGDRRYAVTAALVL
jgi:hypothetical protein